MKDSNKTKNREHNTSNNSSDESNEEEDKVVRKFKKGSRKYKGQNSKKVLESIKVNYHSNVLIVEEYGILLPSIHIKKAMMMKYKTTIEKGSIIEARKKIRRTSTCNEESLF